MHPMLLSALLVLVASCKKEAILGQSIPVIGLDQAGKSTLTYLPQSAFKNKFSPLISGISDQVTEGLDSRQDSDKMPWTLSRVSVGLGIEAEFEVVDELLEAEVESDIELRFQKVN